MRARRTGTQVCRRLVRLLQLTRQPLHLRHLRRLPFARRVPRLWAVPANKVADLNRVSVSE